MNDRKVIPFNPLEKRHLGESVGQAMLRMPLYPLGQLESFIGSGVYAIYYGGEFDAYQAISQENSHGEFPAPIYAGKAIPKGGRKGADLNTTSTGKSLYNRLRQHKRSIEEAGNLAIEDFYCRYLVVDDIWIPLGEALLIAKFQPVWNTLIDGFGNHDPGKGRHAGLRPRWDVLHPGRPWANRCQPRDESQEQIKAELIEYLRNNPPPQDDSLLTT